MQVYSLPERIVSGCGKGRQLPKLDTARVPPTPEGATIGVELEERDESAADLFPDARA